MSLPSGYVDSETYLKDAIEFLGSYQWLFNTPNTHILVKDILSKFNQEWLPHLENVTNEEVNSITTGYIKDSWPVTLKSFLRDMHKLKPSLNVSVNKDINDLPKNWFDGVGVKKKHEILSFAPIIEEHCCNSDIIIDVGAGLGYLPQILYEKYKFKILAIEGDKQKCEAAQQRQDKFYTHSKCSVKYIQHYVTEESYDKINECVQEFTKSDLKNMKLSLIGLHACADLTITMLKLFLMMSNVENIVIMPCCYHRLEIKECIECTRDKFTNFPLSNSLTEIYDANNGEEFLNVPFLRLACQNSSSLWRKMSAEEHLNNSRNLLRRNVLQLVAEKECLQLSRLKRKCKASSGSTSAYINGLKTTHTFYNPKTTQKVSIEELKDKITTSLEENEKYLKLLTVYTGLQTSLQSICENIVLLDRVLFIRDNGMDSGAIQVSNDELSPRCYALVARKPVKS